MNKIILSGKIIGLWKNGLSGEKRGMNILLLDNSIAFKTSVWQEIADWAEDWAIGDEIQMSGECCNIWGNDNGKAIEIRKPKIIAVSTATVEMRQIKKQIAEIDNELLEVPEELTQESGDYDDRENSNAN